MSLSRVLLVSLTERDLCFNIQPSDCICLKKKKKICISVGVVGREWHA